MAWPYWVRSIRVKLQAVDRQIAVVHAHDQAVLGLGGDLEMLGRRRVSTTSEW